MTELLAAALGVAGFARPAVLLLGVAAAAVALFVGMRRAEPSLPWPALGEARVAGARGRDPLRLIEGLLRAGAALGLAIAMAGPLGEGEEIRLHHDGLDLLLVVDASGSMRALDAEVAGETRTRLELARSVVARFAAHRAAEGDRVGLVVFGEHAFTQCPLTSDGVLLEASLRRIEAGVAGEATAVGDALALAVRRILGDDAAGGAQAPEAGRVVVLLTDGRTNAGAVAPDVAAALAKRAGVRVHTVGIGSRGDVAMAKPRGGRSVRTERHDLDAATLQRIATATGGKSFLALTSADLPRVYDEIDALERVPREAPPRWGGRPAPEPFLAGAGALLAIELLIGRIFFRRLP